MLNFPVNSDKLILVRFGINFIDDFNRACQHLDLSPGQAIPHLNSSPNIDAEISQDFKNQLYSHFSKDMALWQRANFLRNSIRLNSMECRKFIFNRLDKTTWQDAAILFVLSD